MDDVRGMSRSRRSRPRCLSPACSRDRLPALRPFFSELRILRAAFETGHYGTAAMFLGCLLFAFFGLTRLVFAIVDGRPRPAARATARRFPETLGVVAPPLVLLACSLWLGLATPAVLREAWTAVSVQYFPAP
jgi:hydrogenase-4 component F